jgi:hypothetical protein
LLAAFLLPVSVMTRVMHVDFWAYYTSNVLYFYGELLLIGLLLWEYLALGLKQPRAPREALPHELAAGLAG